ncbi:MAG: tetratricopeptide repeat protein, partial [Actinomycetota bacterium]
GDAFFAVFPSAASAVAGAVAAQQALAAKDWGDGLEIRVRMGLHTGEGELGGDNYAGIDVNVAARIASAAHGGQVLVSAVTKAAAERRLPEGVRLRDLGTHRLKDLERTEQLYQLCIAGLREEFPPPRTLETNPTNLPEELTSFVPRTLEIRAIRELLSQARLITLTGPGGTGKTRLSLALSRELLPEFRDGVWIAWLAAVEDPMLVPSAIADALSLREETLRPLIETLKNHLADKEALLVLDNFEQILEAAPLVTELLQASPQLQIVVSSRAPLNVSGEQEYLVPAMSLPDPDHLPEVAAASDYEAIALFRERARAVKPAFELTADNLEFVAQICARLDGLPLALELAAARVKLLSPKQIAERLGSGLSLLVSSRRDLPARQQTLRNAIAWSYDLLEPPERKLFTRLAVFRGSWTYEAAEAVCNPDGELGIDSLEGLEALVGHSLLRQYESDAGETRIRMLQTIREFSLEQLAASDEFDDMRRRHEAFYFDHVKSAVPTLTTDLEAASRLEAEHDNLRAVLDWALESKEIELGLDLAALLWRFWQLRGQLREARMWLDALVAASASCSPLVVARGLMALGSIVYWQEEYEQAIAYYRRGLDLFREAEDRDGIAEALYNLGWLGAVVGNFAMAEETLTEARAIHEAARDERGLATMASALGITKARMRQLDEAERLGQEALERWDKLGDWFGESLALFVLLQTARFRGDLETAKKLTVDMLGKYESSGEMSGLEGNVDILGQVLLELGETEAGLRLAGFGAALREKVGGGSPIPLLELEDPKKLASAVLSPDKIEEYYNEGRNLSTQEALAEVRKMKDL